MVFLHLLFFVQVVLESLPISSSGHLILLERLFDFGGRLDLAAQLAVLDARWAPLLHLSTLLIIGIYFLPQYLPVL